MASLLASALAGVVAAAFFADRWVAAAAVVLVQVVLLAGIARSTDVPAARTSALLALVAGAAAAGLVAIESGPLDVDVLRPVLVAVGAGFVATVFVQLTRRDGRDRLTASWTLGVTALVLATSTVAWLGLGDDEIGTALGLLGLAGVATAAAIAIFPGPGWLWAIGGTIGAASIGPIMAVYVPIVDDASLAPGQAALVSGTCGLAAAAGLWVARLVRDDRDAGDAPLPPASSGLVTAALPVVAAAPVAFVSAWAVLEGALG